MWGEGAVLVLGLHRPIDDRFDPVPASRSKVPHIQLPSRGSRGRSTRLPVVSLPLAARGWIMGSANSQVIAVIGIDAPETLPDRGRGVCRTGRG